MVARCPGSRFIGRDAELAELEGLLQEATSGAAAPVLLEGEAGIGKSAFLAEISRRAVAGGWRVAAGSSWHELDAPPYWPWTQIIRKLRGLTRGTDLARVVLRNSDDADNIERFELFDATADIVLSSQRSRPLLVVLDDLHAADLSTLSLTRFIVDQLADRPVQLLGAYRSSDHDRRPEVRAQIDELATRSRVISLRRFDVNEVAELCDDVDVTLDADVVHAVTGGNPLFVEQVMRSGRAGTPGDGSAAGTSADGSLAPAAAGSPRVVDDPLRSAIHGRISGLPASTQVTLAAIAVFRHEIRVAELEQLVTTDHSPSSSQVDEIVDDLITLGLIRRVGHESGPVEVVHPLISEVADLALDSGIAERLHDRAAAVIGEDPDRSSELAHHLSRAGAGRRDDAVRASISAAERAAAVAAHEEAAEHYRRALDALDGVEPHRDARGLLDVGRVRDRRLLDVVLALGRSQRLSGRSGDAERSFDRADELADRLGDPEAQALAALRGGVQLFYRSEVEAARIERVQTALDALPSGDGALRARLLAELAVADDSASTPRSLAADAVAMARRVDDPLAIGYALVAEQVTDLGPDSLTRRLPAAREILELAHRSGEPALATQGRYLLLGAALERGDLRGLEFGTSLESGSALVEHAHERLMRWVGVTRALLEGRPAAAEEIADRGFAVEASAGDPFAARIYGAQLGAIRRLQGRFSELEPIYEAQWHANPDEMMWPAALASMWARSGRLAEARAALDAIGSVDRISPGLHWLVTTSLAAEATALVGHEELGDQLWQRLSPYADRMVPVNLGASVLGPVGLPLGALGARIGRLDEAIAHLERAIRASARVRARWWLIESQIALAEVLVAHRVDGGAGTRTALDAAQRAVALLDDATVAAQQYGFDRLLESTERMRDRLPANAASSTRSPTTPEQTGRDPSPDRPAISVLGAFEVTSADGKVASWSSRKARSLLKILVSRRGAPVRREVLMDLLWPGEEPAAVGNRLSVVLWTVRRALDPDRRADSNEFVAADRESVRVRVDAVRIDSERFLDAAQSALTMFGARSASSDDCATRSVGGRDGETAGHGDDVAEALRAASMLHSGPALPDEPYAAWAAGLESEVRLAHVRVLTALAHIATERGDSLAAADAFRGLIDADPYDRDAHEGLLAALERSGTSAAAEAERRRYDAAMNDSPTIAL